MRYFGLYLMVEIMSEKKPNPLSGDVYLPLFRAAMTEKFGCNFESTYSIFSMSFVTTRVGGKMTKAMKEYGAAFEAGYYAGVRAG